MTTVGPATVTPDPGIHTLPAADNPATGMSPAQISAFRQQFIDLILQAVVSAVEGIFVPGTSASSQLTSWANNIPVIGPLLNLLTGSSTTGGGGETGLAAVFNDLFSLLGGTGSSLGLGTGSPTPATSVGSIPIFGPLLNTLIGLFTGSGGITGLSGLTSVVNDLLGFLGLGTTSGLGTGSVTALVSDIPIFGPLIEAFLGQSGSLADLITHFGVSGPNLPITFPITFGANPTTTGFGNAFLPLLQTLFNTPMSALSEVLGFFGDFTTGGTASTSLLSQLFGAITGTTGGTTGLLGTVESWFTDLLGVFGMSGAGSGLGSGTPILGAVGDIPIFGPLIEEFISMFTGGASSLTGVGGLTSVLSDFMSLFGVTGLGTGNPVLAAVDDIPILGPLIEGFISMFIGTGTGITGFGGLTSIFTDFLGIFGGAGAGGITGLGTGSITLPGLSQIPLLGSVQQIVDYAVQAATGTTTTGNPVTTFFDSITNIQPTSVLGTFGPANVEGTFQHIVDSLTGALNLSGGSGYAPADMATAASGLATTANGNATTLNIRNNKPAWFSVDSTVEATFPLGSITGATMPTFAVTNSTASIGYIRCQQSDVKATIQWLGWWTTGITGLYVSWYKMDPATGNLLLPIAGQPYVSPNLIGGVATASSANPAWNSYTIPTLSEPTVNPGDTLVAMLQITGSGTYNLVGQPIPTPAHPTALPSRIGAQYNNSNTATPLTLPYSGGSVSYVANTPWFGLGLAGGSSYHLPVPQYYTANGAYDYPVPPWAKYIDRIVLGAGAGGQGGDSLTDGTGGTAGTWNADTLTVGAGFPTVLHCVVGLGGAGKPGGAAGSTGSTPGGNGAASSVSGTGVATLTGAGGVGRTSPAASAPGLSPGNETWNGATYPGGAVQNNASQNGSAPGGAGAGGQTAFYFGLSGGNGADGEVIIVARVS